MAVNAAKAYVVPAGVGVLRGIFGPGYGQNNWPTAESMFDTGDGRGPFGAPTDAWNAQRLGYGVLDAPEALQAGMLEARGRYLGGPNNANWSDRWNQWNATDVTGPDGKTLLSPMHQTGLRVGQDYGARDAQGNALTPANNEIFGGFTWTQNQLAQNPYLDPTQQLSGYRSMTAGQPGQADPSEYMRQMLAAGGPEDVARWGQQGVSDVQGLAAATPSDQYGRRGANQVAGLSNRFENQLYRDIDTESANTLANQLPEIQHAMEAAGLGRSGAGQMQMLQAQQDILGQANRDKQRTLASFAESNMGRQAQSTDLASQLQAQGGMQEYGSIADMMARSSQMGGDAQGAYQQRLGGAVGQGLQDRFAGQQFSREAEAGLWSQAMQNQAQQYGQDSSNYLQALTAGGQYGLGALEQERLGQGAALQDWMGLQANRNQTQQDSLAQYLQLANANRGIDQERLNQQLGASMMPLDLMMRIATGTTAPAGPQPGSPSFWNGIGGNLAGGAASGIGQGIGQWAGGQSAEGSSPWLMGE